MSKPLGYAIIQNEWGAITESDTYGCPHCQQVVHTHVGSRKQRGYCFLCNAPTCGLKECMENCSPFLKRIEAAERRDILRRAIERN